MTPPSLERLAGLLAALLLMAAGARAAQAQPEWQTRWLSVGKLHHPYLSLGAEPDNVVPDAYLLWPGLHPGTSHDQWKAMWISVRDYTDEAGRRWDVRTSHVGPRVLGTVEFFARSHRMVSRFAPPVVRVDGTPSFLRPVDNDAVDPDLAPDRMVHTVLNSSVGVTVERKAMQWSHALHESYHLVEYTFTNTGNVDGDEEVEVVGQTLKDVFFVFLDRPKVNAPAGSWDNSVGGNAWGQDTMNDMVGDGHQDYGVTDLRAQFSWMGYAREQAHVFNTLGNPMWYNHQWSAVVGDTLGRLAGAQMVGTVTVHADRSPADRRDDPAQPHTMTYVESDWSDVTTGNDDTDAFKMAVERALLLNGAESDHVSPTPNPRTWPHHAYLVEPGGAFSYPQGDPSLNRAGGWGYLNAYGPYTLAPGEHVTVAVADGVAGLDDDARGRIGRAYKLAGGTAADDARFSYDADGDGTLDPDETMRKNDWVMTSRDSLFQLFRRAVLNYRGAAVPRPPLPPRTFDVTSGTGRVELAWDVYPGAEPVVGWELWRAQRSYTGIVTAGSVENGLGVPDSARAYTCVAGCPGTPPLPPSARRFADEDAAAGVPLFYYLQAVDHPAADPSAGRRVVPMKSNRYYAQTYHPAFVQPVAAEPPGGLPTAYLLRQNYPNPFNPSTVVAYELPRPGPVRLTVYDALGRAVRSLVDGVQPAGRHEAVFDAGGLPSGVYLCVLRAGGTVQARTMLLVR